MYWLQINNIGTWCVQQQLLRYLTWPADAGLLWMCLLLQAPAQEGALGHAQPCSSVCSAGPACSLEEPHVEGRSALLALCD